MTLVSEDVSEQTIQTVFMCIYHSRLHLEWLRWNYWLYHSSDSLVARWDHPSRLWNNIGAIRGKKTKSILAWWLIHLIHPSQPLWSTNSKLGKPKWKESKKKMSVVYNHYSNKLSGWDRKTRSCEIRWSRGIVCRAITPFLNLPTLTEVTTRWHAHLNDT